MEVRGGGQQEAIQRGIQALKDVEGKLFCPEH